MSKLSNILSEEDFKEYKRLRNLEKTYKYESSNSNHVKRHRYRVKLRLVEYKGGKCLQCGYDKPFPSAFVFHHRDPSQKDFTLAYKMNSTSFEQLKKEVDKCDLLCSRCHAEHHEEEYREAREKYLPASLLRAQNVRARRKQILQKYGLTIDAKKTCPSCGKEFLTRFPLQECCQSTCAKKMLRKAVRPTKEELQQLMRTKGWAELGRQFRVTDNTVKGWAVTYGLEIPIRRIPVTERPCNQCGKMYRPENKEQQYCSSVCRSTAHRKVIRPSFEELLELRKTESLMQIGSRYGVNWCTVKEWIKTYARKLETP